MSDKHFGDVCVGRTVRVPISDFDRGKGDARNILALVLEKTNDGFYRLGSRNGIINKLYARSQFTVCEENILSSEDIPQNECSVRSIATAQSVGSGQGMQKCSCTKQCRTNRCACRKNNRLCNSRCHNSLTCTNK